MYSSHSGEIAFDNSSTWNSNWTYERFVFLFFGLVALKGLDLRIKNDTD